MHRDSSAIPPIILYYVSLKLQTVSGSSSVTLLGDRQLDTLTLWQGDPWLTSLGTNNENVGSSGDESVVQSVLDVDQVETTLVLLSVHNDTNSTQVLTTSDNNQLAGVELDVVGDLTGSQVDLDSVVGSDQWVWVSDGSTVVGDSVWDTSLTQSDLLDLTQLVRSLLSGDSVDSESTLDVVHQSEVLVGGLQGNDIHETSWVGGVGSDLTVNLDVLLHQDSLDLSTVQSVLQSVSQEHDQWQRLSQLVWTSRWSWGVGAGQLVQHPVGWGCQSLKVLLSVIVSISPATKNKHDISSFWKAGTSYSTLSTLPNWTAWSLSINKIKEVTTQFDMNRVNTNFSRNY